MKIRATVQAIEDGLRDVGTPERARGEKRYLKSDLDFLGVAVPQIRKQAGAWLRLRPEASTEDLRRLSRALWQRRTHELRSFGVEILVARVNLLTAEDFALAEWILTRANTWAHVDPVSVHIAGPLSGRFPGLESHLDSWAEHEIFWLRRAALLSHLLQLRRGEGQWHRFVRYAAPMLDETEFFIRKAIGWVLREAGRATPDRVTDFVESHLNAISGLSLREALKHLPTVDRERLLQAYRER